MTPLGEGTAPAKAFGGMKGGSGRGNCANACPARRGMVESDHSMRKVQWSQRQEPSLKLECSNFDRESQLPHVIAWSMMSSSNLPKHRRYKYALARTPGSVPSSLKPAKYSMIRKAACRNNVSGMWNDAQLATNAWRRKQTVPPPRKTNKQTNTHHMAAETDFIIGQSTVRVHGANAPCHTVDDRSACGPFPGKEKETCPSTRCRIVK